MKGVPQPVDKKAKCPMCKKQKTTLVAFVVPHSMGYRPDKEGNYMYCEMVHPCKDCYAVHEKNLPTPSWKQYEKNGECSNHKGKAKKVCCPAKKTKPKPKKKELVKVQLTQTLVNRVMSNGPTEIMVGLESKVKRSAATKQQQKNVTVIFIRDDGVSIGAEQCLAADVAFLDPERWVGVIQKPARVAVSFQEWMKSRPR